ncbi:MAG: hypothetical protein E6J91_13115 [Deltaproteobacteria bacterium]|nr:MAG: hypothetical protein E6J91_13115 [Deltaproteobacteria bacterium]
MTEPSDPRSPEVPELAALAPLVARVAQILQGGDDPAARSAAAASVEDLRAVVARTEPQGAVAGFDRREPSAGGGDPDGLAGGAGVPFAEWLRAPTPDREARAERAMSELQAVLGPLVGWNPAREDAERRAQYRREARAALDEIFPDKPKR